MTAKQLIKRLQSLVGKHGNVTVGADWQALRDSSNGVYEIANLTDVDLQVINQVDGDGFTIVNKDGTERTRRVIVLS